MHVFAERPSDYGWYLLTFGTFLDEFSPNSPDTIPQRPSAASFESLAERNRESLDSQQMTKCVSEHTHTHTQTHTHTHTHTHSDTQRGQGQQMEGAPDMELLEASGLWDQSIEKGWSLRV